MVCFDLDGTLLRGTTVSLFTAERLGRTGEYTGLEERYAAGETTNASSLHGLVIPKSQNRQLQTGGLAGQMLPGGVYGHIWVIAKPGQVVPGSRACRARSRNLN